MRFAKIFICSFGAILLIAISALSFISHSMQASLDELVTSVKSIDAQISKIPVVLSNKALATLSPEIDWSSTAGREMAKKIGSSSRLSDIASYLLTAGQRQSLTANDVKVIRLAEAQLEIDSALNTAFGAMAMKGFAGEIVNSDRGYVIRGLWHLDTPDGSDFAKQFPLGGRSVLHAESIAMPVCKTGDKPIAVYAPMHKQGSKLSKATIVEEKGRWRFFLDSETPYEYRVLVDTGCVKTKENLVAPKKQNAASGATTTQASQG